MPDKKALESASQTGAVRIVREPRAQHESPQPTVLPEMPDDGATGRMAIITEGKDRSAALDQDSGQEG